MIKSENQLTLEYATLALRGIDDEYRKSTLTDRERERMAEIREALGADNREIMRRALALLVG